MIDGYKWLTPLSQQFLEKDYLAEGQSVDERVDIICNHAEKILKKPGFAKKFKSNFKKGWYSLSTPIWANFGTNRGLPISCFGLTISDKMESILYSLAEVGMQSKFGGGTSAFFGNLRGRGETITNNGVSSGSIHFMQLFDKMTGIISQGSTRRGSFAAYLPVDHKDIDEFLTIRSEGSPVQDISFGVCIPEGWMQSMIDGNSRKRDVWAKVLDCRFRTGYPYIFWADNVNNNTVDVYRDKDRKITHSNLCVAPETLLLTLDGEKPISTLVNQLVKIYNGKKWTPALVMKTGENQKLIRVNFKKNQFLDCTPYHKFPAYRGRGGEGHYLELQADELKPQDRIVTISARCQEIYKSFTEVVSIEDLGRYDDTYCVTEPIEHKVVLNNLLTFNCSEILLSDNEEESFVCDLSSMNILYYDSWKSTNAVQLLTIFLDSVMSDFIDRAKNIKFMERAVKFAENQRALGIGWLGWHSYLQSKMIPFESMEAKYKNVEIAKHIKEESLKASQQLAKEYGEPELLKGYGRRNTHTCALAPTKSSSFIIQQVSENVEPFRSNYYIKDLAKGKFPIKNPYLEKLLKKKRKNTDEVWDSILKRAGSVQHLDFLKEDEKMVFKTMSEISPMEIIIQASGRQPYIDQGQSINLMIPPAAAIKDVNKLMIEAWKMGCKSLYYQLGSNPAQNLVLNLLSCQSCEA